VNILLVASEAIPFAKTGGLADVAGSLPVELARLGHHVTLMLPAYRQTRQSGLLLEPTDVELNIPIGNKISTGRLLRSQIPDSNVTVYLVEQEDYFNRPELYGEGGHDYRDNCERFVFFCRSVMESIRLLDLSPNVVHANDWQTGLISAYLAVEYRDAPGFEDIASLFTIHNMAYQGQFWHWDMLLTGLDWKYFNWHQMEFYGSLNLLKTGIVFADAVTTVSPTYANEIQHSDLGCGLQSVLRQRGETVSGIINGVDYSIWNPRHDEKIARNYSVDDWSAGKSECKSALQREMGLPERGDVPLIGVVGRLVDQKGFDLIARVMRQWVEHVDVQWVILGTGEPSYHELLAKLQSEHPTKVGTRLEFADSLAHRIEAGADMFLMPSRYEPCGLNQLYSLKYGTIPVVHRTGGLADTIVHPTGETLAMRTANGFSFEDYDATALESVLGVACEIFRNDRAVWEQLVNTAMRQDWSWKTSARKYEQLYEETLQQVTETACT
jgi:starch synthase